MKMIEYRTIKEFLYNADIGNYISYGITANLIKDGREVEILHISDVFLSYEKASDLVRLCNKNNLNPIHLMDVIEDAIC